MHYVLSITFVQGYYFGRSCFNCLKRTQNRAYYAYTSLGHNIVDWARFNFFFFWDNKDRYSVHHILIFYQNLMTKCTIHTLKISISNKIHNLLRHPVQWKVLDLVRRECYVFALAPVPDLAHCCLPHITTHLYTISTHFVKKSKAPAHFIWFNAFFWLAAFKLWIDTFSLSPFLYMKHFFNLQFEQFNYMFSIVLDYLRCMRRDHI